MASSRENTPWFDPAVAAYVAAHTEQPDAIQLDLIAETVAITGEHSRMQISPDEGALIGLLVRLIGARNAVEVGTFTGYSSLCIARALPADGQLLCLDVSEEWTAVARKAWERAGVGGKVELRIGPAIDSLQALPPNPTFDLAFIDADKPSYPAYYEEILPRLRTGGVILVDNTLWSGEVAKGPAPTGSATAAIQAFNDLVAADVRVESYILPISDGLTLIRKR